MNTSSMTPVGHEEVFAIEENTIVFHNLTDVSTATTGVVARPLVLPATPFRQPNEPGSLRRSSSLEEVCLRAQQAAIRTLGLFDQE